MIRRLLIHLDEFKLPTFMPSISLNPEGKESIYVGWHLCPASYAVAPSLLTRAKSNREMLWRYAAPTDRRPAIICARPSWNLARVECEPRLLRRIRFKPRAGLASHPEILASGRQHLRAHKIGSWPSSMWIKQSRKQFYGTSENAVKIADLDCRAVYVLVAIVKKRSTWCYRSSRVTLFEKMPIHRTAGDENRCNASQITNQLNLFVLTGTVNPLYHRGKLNM